MRVLRALGRLLTGVVRTIAATIVGMAGRPPFDPDDSRSPAPRRESYRP